MNKVDKLFVATKAFIIHDGKVLVVREASRYQDGANIGKFDVVGGRVRPGEKFDDSLRREIKEETGLEVTIGQPFFVNEWRPVVKGEQWQVVGIFFVCTPISPQVHLSPDHSEFRWLDPQNYEHEEIIDNLRPAFAAFLTQS